jgi:hypothetical protein
LLTAEQMATLTYHFLVDIRNQGKKQGPSSGVSKTSLTYEERHLDKLKHCYDHKIRKEADDGEFVEFLSCSSIMDLKNDGNSNQFALTSTIMICPFSSKYGSSQMAMTYNLQQQEVSYFSQIPKCLIADMEDLGLNTNHELQREYYDNVETIFPRIPSMLFTSTTSNDACFKCAEMRQCASEEKPSFFFNNPVDKFLKAMYRGDTKAFY